MNDHRVRDVVENMVRRARHEMLTQKSGDLLKNKLRKKHKIIRQYSNQGNKKGGQV